MPTEPPANPVTTSPESLTRLEPLCEQLKRSDWWLRDKVQRGLVDHVRVGRRPAPGQRDTRPIAFTPEQVEQVKALATRVEIEVVPAAGGAA